MRQSNDGERNLDDPAERLRAALAHRDRRAVLRALADRPDSVHVTDLARDVVERSAAGGAVPDREAVDVCLQLPHVHLPKLDDAGLVSFDAGAKVVRPSPAGRSGVS